MFNITVNLKKLLRKFFLILIFIFIVAVFIRFSKDVFKNLFNLVNKEYSKIFSLELSFSNYERISFEKGTQKILSSELVKINDKKEDTSKFENNSNDILNKNTDDEKKDEELELKVEENKEQAIETNSNEVIIYSNLKTEVITDKNLKESYNAEYHGIKIKNESNYTLTDDILNPNIDYTNKKDILIFHTHTCESYTSTKKMQYKESGNFRTTDLNYSVARVGEELTQNLVSKNFNVIHDTTYHDYPAYTGSYNRSLLTVKNILEKNSQIQTVIDLHRDAIGSNSEYAPSVKIGEEKVAQLMFVIGTDGGGLEHPNWNNNLKYAVKIQQKANEMFPGLFKPIIVRNSRYNQHLSSGACIIEVGATGNTLEECIKSMKYLAEVLDAVMK